LWNLLANFSTQFRTACVTQHFEDTQNQQGFPHSWLESKHHAMRMIKDISSFSSSFFFISLFFAMILV
jgi:hypothetical protein